MKGGGGIINGVKMGIREQNYKERQILTECRDKRGGESWGTLECVGLGVRVCIILYILLYYYGD